MIYGKRSWQDRDAWGKNKPTWDPECESEDSDILHVYKKYKPNEPFF
jgi:hypothetical protein